MGKFMDEMSGISKSLDRKATKHGALAFLYLILGGVCTGLAVNHSRRLGWAENGKFWTNETAKVFEKYDMDTDSNEESEGANNPLLFLSRKIHTPL